MAFVCLSHLNPLTQNHDPIGQISISSAYNRLSGFISRKLPREANKDMNNSESMALSFGRPRSQHRLINVTGQNEPNRKLECQLTHHALYPRRRMQTISLHQIRNMMAGSKHKVLACVGESRDWFLRSHARTVATLASTG